MGADSQFDQNFDTDTCRGKRPLRDITSTPSHSDQTQDTLTPSPEQHEDYSKSLKLVKTLMKCWTAEHRWSRCWNIPLDAWWRVSEWKPCPRAAAPGCAAKLPLCYGRLCGSSGASGGLVYKVSWEIILFIFMTADIHLNTAWVPLHPVAFQEQPLFCLKSFAIDFSVSLKEFWGGYVKGVFVRMLNLGNFTIPQ